MAQNVFNEQDYNSNDGMLTYVWGPALWHSLHTITFNYPVKPTKEQKIFYFNFFTDLKNVLPCKYCRDNFELNLKAKPLSSTVLKNRENFSRWLYEMHELINTNLGKQSKLTYEEVRNRYEHFRSRCLIDPKKVKSKEKTKEKGCTESLYGIKSKCIINIVPKDSNVETFKMDKKCKFIKG
uniref:thiol oxidase n=1 Tax=viral metagenome TaxID=1070528 RepID=A0A6C0DBP8_9ZZZZ